MSPEASPEKLAREFRRRAGSRGFPAVLSLRHLAVLIDVPYKDLRRCARSDSHEYRQFVIRKRSDGGERRIAAPYGTRLTAQRWINRRILRRAEPHHAATAYRRERGLTHAVAPHLGARWLIKMDIHDFFESVSERQVFHVFDGLGCYPRLVSFQLSRLATIGTVAAGRFKSYRWSTEHYTREPGGILPNPLRTRVPHLPQGAPTSPALSNLVCRELDAQLAKLAKQHQLAYSRYSDDMAFSTTGSFDRDRAGKFISHVEDLLLGAGFIVHRRKTRISPPGARKLLLGLLIDQDVPRLTRSYKANVGTHLRGIEKFGLANHARHRDFHSVIGFVRHLDGLLRHASSIEPQWAEAGLQRLEIVLRQHAWR